MSGIYAEDTKVSVEQSQVDIERLVTRAGATQFWRGFEDQHAAVGFALNGRRIQFTLMMPTAATVKRKKGSSSSPERIAERLAKARWRALFLTIKAKLISVEAGIETFEESFLGQILVPHDGRAVRFSTLATEAILQAYTKGGNLPPLLPSGGGE